MLQASARNFHGRYKITAWNIYFVLSPSKILYRTENKCAIAAWWIERSDFCVSVLLGS